MRDRRAPDGRQQRPVGGHQRHIGLRVATVDGEDRGQPGGHARAGSRGAGHRAMRVRGHRSARHPITVDPWAARSTSIRTSTDAPTGSGVPAGAGSAASGTAPSGPNRRIADRPARQVDGGPDRRRAVVGERHEAAVGPAEGPARHVGMIDAGRLADAGDRGQARIQAPRRVGRAVPVGRTRQQQLDRRRAGRHPAAPTLGEHEPGFAVGIERHDLAVVDGQARPAGGQRAVAVRQDQLIAGGERAPRPDEPEPTGPVRRHPVGEMAAGELGHPGQRGVGRDRQPQAAPAREMVGRTAPEARPEMVERRRRRRQRGRREDERRLRPAVVEPLAREGDRQAGPGGQDEAVEPAANERSRVPVGRPDPFRRRVGSGPIVEAVARGVIRPDIFVRDGDRRDRRRAVAGQAIELVADRSDRRGEIGQHLASWPQPTGVIGHAELGLVRLADVRRPTRRRPVRRRSSTRRGTRSRPDRAPTRRATGRSRRSGPGRTGPTMRRIRGA